jgi:hypothetical protein
MYNSYMTTLNKEFKVTVIKYSNAYHLRSKDGDVHSTRYPTKDQAAIAAKKMALGLIHFAPISANIPKLNLTNNA